MHFRRLMPPHPKEGLSIAGGFQTPGFLPARASQSERLTRVTLRALAPPHDQTKYAATCTPLNHRMHFSPPLQPHPQSGLSIDPRTPCIHHYPRILAKPSPNGQPILHHNPHNFSQTNAAPSAGRSLNSRGVQTISSLAQQGKPICKTNPGTPRHAPCPPHPCETIPAQPTARVHNHAL